MTATSSGSAKTRTQYLRLFQDVTRTISASLDIDEVLSLIVQKVPEVVGVCAATIRLLDAQGQRLELLAAYGLSEAYLNRGPVDAEAGVTQALKGTPVVIGNAPNDPRIHYCAEAKAEGIRGILVAPIPIGGEVKGILRLLTRTRRTYDREEIDFITAIAEQCGIAIENARVHEARKNQLAFFKTLVDIGKALNSTRDLGEVLDLMVTRLPEVMTLKGCTIRLLDPNRHHLELVAASGLSEAYLNRGSIDDEISTHQALKGETVEIFDAAAAPENRYAKQARLEGIASILAVPIMVRGRIIGVLRLLSVRPRHFTEAEVNFAMAVAEQGGIAIRNASSYQQITKLVTELEQHESFLQHVINSLGADLFVLDANRRIVMVNSKFLENRHMEEWAVIGRPCREIIGLCNRED